MPPLDPRSRNLLDETPDPSANTNKAAVFAHCTFYVVLRVLTRVVSFISSSLQPQLATAFGGSSSFVRLIHMITLQFSPEKGPLLACWRKKWRKILRLKSSPLYQHTEFLRAFETKALAERSSPVLAEETGERAISSATARAPALEFLGNQTLCAKSSSLNTCHDGEHHPVS